MLSSTRLLGGKLLNHPHRWKWAVAQHLPPSRFLSGTNTYNDDDNHEAEYALRHYGIQVHPDSISSKILPGNFVLRESKSGKKKKRYTELVHGYFWMMKDLTKSNDKPIQTNKALIPESRSKVFPVLQGLKSLDGQQVNFPDYVLRKNRSKDAAAQCTVVAISFRDFGYGLLSSWLDPFQKAMSGMDRVEVVRLNLTEGWFNKWILRGFILGLMKKNTPKADHDRTFVYFGGSDLESFQDCLRMHNILTGYVFLLDGLGRVRFAGSGPATEEDVERLIRFAKDLTPLLKPGARRGMNVPKRATGKRPRLVRR